MMLKAALFSLVILFLTGVSPLSARENIFWGRVCKVKDGDSLVVATGGGKREIRLYGIDAPEYGQPGGREARLWLKKNVAGKLVHVRVMNRDRYGRLVAIIINEGITLNEALVDRGLAQVYPAYCRRAICDGWREKEREAIKQKRGLWRRHNPVAPWDWRHHHRRM